MPQRIRGVKVRTAYIIETGKELAEAYGIPADAKDICREEGILLLEYPMGTKPQDCKGFLIKSSGKVAITVNADLSPEMRQIVRYHELGHYFLHVKTGLMEAVHDETVYDRISEAELEANMLAAELQLSDEKVTEAFREYGDFFSAATALTVPAELLDFKVRLMRHKGYALPEAPVSASGGYLAKR